VIATVNESWGGATLVLDTSRDDVLEHLEQLARTLVAMGWCYLKLDYTYAPSFPGQWSDAGLTPAQRVRAGYDAIRRGAGDDTFVLGCGAPLGACIGVVDGMRVGPDVAPWWDPPTRYDAYVGSAPATQNAFRNTLARSFQHRRLWLNDPDCLMLRTTDTRLTRRHIETWTDVVARTGGMALLSDDLALLDASARRMLHDAIETGRAVDAQAITGAAPSCPDVVDHWLPTQLRSGGETTTYTFDA
jgi:alpha-galactosidase